jgi:hypothetical protein
MNLYKAFILFFVIGLLSKASFALVPLESILLGDFSDQYRDRETDPIEYIFSTVRSSTEVGSKDFEYRRKLALYRGFFEEGQNLKNLCKVKPKVQYSVDWDRRKVVRSIIATLQYIGLDAAVRAMPKYANHFEFSEDEYKKLGDNLIGNWCSQNLSFISISQLKKNWMIKFTKKNDFKLPSVVDDPLFPQKVNNITSKERVMKQEFAQTIKMFKTFCSWGGDTDNVRLLVPLLRHPIIYSFIARQLTGQKLEWKPIENKILIKEDQPTVKVLCKNMICRKTDQKTMLREFPRGAGTKSIKEDLDRLYCEEVRDVDYTSKDQEPKIKEWIKKISFDEENLIVSYFISLMTGIPDFFLRSESYNEGVDFLRLSLDRNWNSWSEKQTTNFTKDLYYEEPLTIELVDRKLYYQNVVQKFSVHFDVNLGEFDRSNQKVGKISNYFELKISKTFLKWAREEWNGISPLETQKKTKIVNRFKQEITEGVQKARSKYRLPPWKGDLEKIIALELLEQLVLFNGLPYKGELGLAKIPVKLNFAPLALRYIRYQYKVKQNSIRDDEYFKDLKKRREESANLKQ